MLVAHRPNQYKRYEKNNSISIVDGWSHGNGGRKQDDAFKKLTGDNKELLILPGANHVDLYDNLSVIPFDKIEHFFHKYLK